LSTCPQARARLSGLRLHFWLARAAAARRVEIRRLSGARQALENVAADQVLATVESLNQ